MWFVSAASGLTDLMLTLKLDYKGGGKKSLEAERIEWSADANIYLCKLTFSSLSFKTYELCIKRKSSKFMLMKYIKDNLQPLLKKKINKNNYENRTQTVMLLWSVWQIELKWVSRVWQNVQRWENFLLEIKLELRRIFSGRFYAISQTADKVRYSLFHLRSTDFHKTSKNFLRGSTPSVS